MPAWFIIYCNSPIDDVEPSQLDGGLKPCDWWTEAEHFEIDESLVDPALALFQIDRVSNGFELIYRPVGQRQLAIHLWTEVDRINVDVEEVIESFEGDFSEKAKRIRARMADVVAVVGIEMGFSQLEDMGIVFASEVARWFGEFRNGVIKDDNDRWFLIEDGAFVRL